MSTKRGVSEKNGRELSRSGGEDPKQRSAVQKPAGKGAEARKKSCLHNVLLFSDRMLTYLWPELMNEAQGTGSATPGEVRPPELVGETTVASLRGIQGQGGGLFHPATQG